MEGFWRKLKKSVHSSKLSPASSSSSSLESKSNNNGSPTVTDIATSSPPPTTLSSRFSRSFSLHSSSKAQKICAICLGSLRAKGQAIFTATCSHSFHFNCIATNVKHGNRTCPSCRSEWKDIPFQAPSNLNMGRARVSPYVAPPEDIRLSGALRNFRLPSPPHREPHRFSDDEPLPATSKDSALPSRPQTLTINAFPELNAVSASDCSPNFGVLVRICAPPLRDDAPCLDRAPIDLVTVLDVSSSMAGKLSLLKLAVCFIIQNLGPSDRLSIVTFSSTAHRIFPLRRMSDGGHEDAIRVINSLSSNGGTNIVEGLKKGVRVLEERREHNSVASIILLSDGQDTYNFHNHYQSHSMQNQPSSNARQKLEYLNLMPVSICSTPSKFSDGVQQPTIPVHTFGFGSEHDSTSMHAISDASGGTYSFIESIDILQDAFARCIGGLLSVVAQDLRLTVMSVTPTVQIKSISSGKYKSEVVDGGNRAVVTVGNLYADEEKEFLVYISIPVSLTAEGEERLAKTSLLIPLCSYKDSASMEVVHVEGEKVEVQRPEVLSPTDKIVCLEVDRQKNRLWVAEAIADAKAMAEMGNLEDAQALLTLRRLTLLSSASAQAGDILCNWLEAEMREIRARMASMELYEHTGRAYILSGMSSHSLQRATTRGDSTPTTHDMTGEGGNSSRSATISYETPSMVGMVSRSQVLSSAPGGHQILHKSCSLIQHHR
ncbi:VWA domain-containing protein/zf-RING_2 domain-containing protein [Cephalotus follicularis]|uniref:VWA domain-containing protein/zf-RING_2 domain-containing protein n=1 Tax=Cephalotus follicularis TaxID=3775 RepID=A0A1Q3CS04_CEPFO|nr:VWA domain-containing protein/zf-RING_2 domain-containing protein [Cephalotus follicularis]